ncbi:MAG: sugar transporter [Nitrospirales bacterium]|nr:MAG: sugar transporter [Nitrospirales bacterium]
MIQLYGQRNERYALEVTRDGVLQFPEVGPLTVAGLTFAEIRELIETTVTSTLIGQRVSVTMGALRSIQIFVLGEAFRSGSYTVSSLSTMTNALFVSGGITKLGSLRNIRLMRAGELVTELDLYDLLLRGDTSGDARLQPNDVIFIPPIGKTLGIAGDVKRPAIFELKDEETLADAIHLGGGFLPTAYPSASRIERIDAEGQRTLVDVDLSNEAELDISLRDGDVLQVYSILNQVEGVVQLQGHVNRPGSFTWYEGLRVNNILSTVGDMLPNPDLEYALIVREIQPTRRIELIYVNLNDVFSNQSSPYNFLLEPRDQLLTFGAAVNRQSQVSGLLSRLREQSSFDVLPLIVSINGNVRFPGEYPLVRGMSLNDLIRFSGGLSTYAELDYGLVERTLDQTGEIEVYDFSIDENSFTATSNLQLGPMDRVMLFDMNASRSELLEGTLQRLRSQATRGSPTKIASISGSVRFPGEYPITEGLDVEQLIKVAGGFLESADIENSEITHYGVGNIEGREVEHLPINLTNPGQRGLGYRLRSYDQLVVRQMPNWTGIETVSIGGEVVSPGVYTISKDEKLSAVIARAGGLTEFADARAAIFLRAELREKEQELLNDFSTRLRQSLLNQSLLRSPSNSEQSNIDIEVMNQLLAEVNQAQASGRLVLDLPALLRNPGGAEDVILRAGDELLLPRTRQEVSVVGEVQRPTSHLYQESLQIGDYIAKSGGVSDNSDSDSIFVIRANGDLIAHNDSRWFFQRRTLKIEPGDSIVVPFNAAIDDPLYTWTSISTVLFNLATAVLAIESVNN